VKTYRVKITETLQLSVECKAQSEEQAEMAVRDGYKAGNYVLGAEHFAGVEFTVSKVADES
jgi:hypothetical protein